jgi:nucleotide-binding universal stress UspA family protein
MKVLIAYDGSPYADEAIDDLPRAGLPANVEASVLSVADLWVLPEGESEAPPPLGPSHTIREARRSAVQMQERARLHAEMGAARVRNLFPTWQVTAEAASDSPAWAIILKAENWGADLIVVGSHGYSTLGRWVLGSVSHTVVTHAHTSVRVSRGRPTPPARPLRILVGIDGSIESDLAVRTVAQRAWPAETDIRMMLVLNQALLEDVHEGEYARQEAKAGHTVDEWEDDEVEEIDGLIGRMFESYTGLFANSPGLSVSSHIRSGDPKRVLLEEAKEWGADCIFLGSRGLNRWERLLLGSVSSAVVTRAHCSVEVTRMRQEERGN